MRIGIITWFKYENYGTALQAIALQRYIRDRGHEATLVNFSLNDSVNTKKPFFAKKILFKAQSVIIHSLLYGSLKEKRAKFKKIIDNNCILSREIFSRKDYIDICNSFDLLLFGSDQIWNPNWYHPFYYANYPEIKSPKISYAPSFGVQKATKNIQNITNALNTFDSISVREDSGKKIISDLTQKNANVVVDPTLLLQKTDWQNFKGTSNFIHEKYLLCYFLTDNKTYWKTANDYAKKKNLKLVIIPTEYKTYFRKGKIIHGCGVEDFLTLIDNAEYIFTDSFHGTVFSLIFGKKFAIFERHDPTKNDSQNGRLYSLLEKTSGRNSIIQYNSSGINEDSNILHGEKLYNKLEKEIQESKNFLTKAITKRM